MVEKDKTTYNISQKQAEDIKETFDLLDGDKDGYITIKELGDTMKLLGENIKDIDITDIAKELELDNIDYKTFEAFWIMKYSEDLVVNDFDSLFKYFDIDKNGLVEARDLMEGLKALGAKVTPEEADEMILEADLDGDRLMDKEEFIRMMNGI